MDVSELESRVCSYARNWPVTFVRAQGSTMVDEDGREYLDFFAGAGSLNYGHNHPVLVDAMVRYLAGGGPLNGLDVRTAAKRDLLVAMEEILLAPRDLDYRVQFTGPTGSSAVEAALRLARKATGRRRVVHLSGSYHGMTVDAVSVSDLSVAGLPRLDPGAVTCALHEADAGDEEHAWRDLRRAFDLDAEAPAALVVETVQGEGGARPASSRYLRRAQDLCERTGTVLVVDDVQAGCGRTGPFFSFERAGVRPGIVCLSKSLSAVGLPLSVVLIAERLDVWEPGEHTGTFRGNQLAFVTARLGLATWWRDGALQELVGERSAALRSALGELSTAHPDLLCPPCGTGLLLGLPCRRPGLAAAAARAAFERGLLVETCGAEGTVVKLLPPLTVSRDEAERAIDVLDAVFDELDAGPAPRAERRGQPGSTPPQRRHTTR